MAKQPATRTVQALRVDRGWSQEHLAGAAGVSVRTIQRIESGAPASLESLQALAAAFDTEVTHLLDGSRSMLGLFQQALDTGQLRPDPVLGNVACPDCHAPASDFGHKVYGDDAHTVIVASCPRCGWSDHAEV